MTLLKFKRNKATYVLPIDLHLKSQLKVKNFVTHLVKAINNSGGLLIEESVIEGEGEDDNDIPIPKSEYIEENEDDIPIPESEFNDGDEKIDIEETKPLAQVTEEEITLAIPQDKTSPYSNKWIELSDSSIAEIEFHDYDVLGFKYVTDSDFNIIEAVYND